MKERLDKYLTDLGYFETKSKASAAILAGHVKINDEYITKAGFQINPSKEYDIQVKSMPYVSRGGFKLKKALDTFPVKIENRICLDAGASTGGFTDCLLQNGAKFVYAADVGYGQLDWKIRSDKRVKTIERTNLKICSYNEIYEENEPVADLLVSDLSFISLTSSKKCLSFTNKISLEFSISPSVVLSITTFLPARIFFHCSETLFFISHLYITLSILGEPNGSILSYTVVPLHDSLKYSDCAI